MAKEMLVIDTERVKRDIIRARKWAREHFNTSEADTLLDPPAFDIVIHDDPDKIVVYVRSYGKRMWPGVTYQLIWKDKGMYWKGQHPFFTDKTWLLKIT